MVSFADRLAGTDLRSIGNTGSVISLVQNKHDFDKLFALLQSNDRVIAMHAADAVEKITRANTTYLEGHEHTIAELTLQAGNKELLWHLALLVPRINLRKEDQHAVVFKLIAWAKDKQQSKIVRVNALQALYELTGKEVYSKHALKKLLHHLEEEQIPSLNARIKKIIHLLPECKGGGDCSCCAL